ncbi:MAG: hypothetical protein KF686_14110 [Ramlibacter sp.]|nr:hypothetical protein [Ramlibacter sp.]
MQVGARVVGAGRVGLALWLCWGLLTGCGGGAADRNPGPTAPATVAPSEIRQADATILPVTGWYWNPAEGGRGFAIERQGDKLFVAAFLYETSGAPTWYVATLSAGAAGQYVGEFSRYTGGQSLLGGYRAPVAAKVADVVLTFSSSTNATLRATPVGGSPVSIALQRFAISSPAFEPSKVSFSNGWYWNEAEGGRGYFIEVQGSQAFIGSFMYDTNGQPVWYVSTASVDKLASVAGLLKQYSGGQSLSGAFKAATENPVSPGRMSFDLAASGQGQMVLPNGSSVPMKPFAFNGGQATLPQVASCPEGQSRANGTCVTVDEPLIIAPRIALNVGVVPQMGQTYQIVYCRASLADCVGLHTAQYVSYEDLRDPETPAILAYVDKVIAAFQSMISQMAKARHMPSDRTLQGILGAAIDKAIRNQSQTAETDAQKALNDLGYPVTLDGSGSTGGTGGSSTGADANSSCTTGAAPLGNGPVIAYTDSATIPAKCYKDRLYTFGWTQTDDATAADACRAAQDPSRNGDLQVFNAQNVSACYCKANGTVNGITMKYVCNVFFDAGK